MPSRRRNLLILIALVCAWGLILVLRSPWNTSATPQAKAKGTPVAPPRAPMAQGGGLPRLRRDLVGLPLPTYPPEVQNIFGTPPPPPPAPPPPGPNPSQAALASAPPPPPPPDPFQEEAKRLRYIGFLRGPGKMTAFIVHGSEVHTLDTGATLLGRFRIQAIAEDWLLLASPTGDKQVRLPLAVEAGAAVRR